MNLVLFTHPAFLGLTSQGHFARMLVQAYRRRGHQVQLRQPQALTRRLFAGGAWARLAKWAGYVDQYLLFPWSMWWAMRSDPPQTLYVFCDQALGPWVPYVAHRPHVVHCHDLLALRSALGDVPQNPTSPSGRLYQRYIRWGFKRGRHFISVSQATRADLHRFGQVRPLLSEVVYNGLNQAYRRVARKAALNTIRAAGLPWSGGAFILHVGGGQWYKNSEGVLHLYSHYVRLALADSHPVLPLWMVSPPPAPALQGLVAQLPAPGQVHFVNGLDGACLQALYSSAEMLLFPSLAEGFGWPIAEACACGCPVLTTADAPMNEVGGPVAHYLPLLRPDDDVQAWAACGARSVRRLLARGPTERAIAAEAAMAWARRFSTERAIERYLEIYHQVFAGECPRSEIVSAP